MLRKWYFALVKSTQGSDTPKVGNKPIQGTGSTINDKGVGSVVKRYSGLHIVWKMSICLLDTQLKLFQAQSGIGLGGPSLLSIAS